MHLNGYLPVFLAKESIILTNDKLAHVIAPLVSRANSLKRGLSALSQLLRRISPFRSKGHSHGSRKRGKIAEFFDVSWYLSQNADVKAKGIDPVSHYIEYGWREGRWPNQIFDPIWYTKNYPDVDQHNVEPFEHFLRHGRFEGRRPSALFDQSSYLRLNPDVANSNIEPFTHYMQYGRHEGRKIFDETAAKSPSTLPYLRPPADTAHVSTVIFAMRDKTTSSLKSLPKEAVSEAVHILNRFDEAKLPWQMRILSKTIYRLDIDATPTPDGLSYAYLELADALNDGRKSSEFPSYNERIATAQTDPLGALEALVQRELGEAAKLQAKLFQDREAQCFL